MLSQFGNLDYFDSKLNLFNLENGDTSSGLALMKAAHALLDQGDALSTLEGQQLEWVSKRDRVLHSYQR